LRKVIPGDTGGVNPKHVAAAETPIPLGLDLPVLGIPQLFWDFLHQPEVFPLTSRIRADLRGLKLIKLHWG